MGARFHPIHPKASIAILHDFDIDVGKIKNVIQFVSEFFIALYMSIRLIQVEISQRSRRLVRIQMNSVTAITTDDKVWQIGRTRLNTRHRRTFIYNKEMSINKKYYKRIQIFITTIIPAQEYTLVDFFMLLGE